MDQRYRALGYVLLLGLILGSNLVVSRFSLGQYDPMAYISLRILIAAVLYVLVYAISTRQSWPTDLGLWWRAGIYGVLGTAIPVIAFVSSLQYQSSGLTALLITLVPIVTVLLAQLFLADEPLTWHKVVGALIAFGGAGMLIWQGETGLQDLESDWRGYAWVAFGIFGVSTGLIYARLTLGSYKTYDVASVRMVVAAFVAVPIALFTVGYDFSRVETSGVLALAYAGSIGTFAMFFLYFYITKRFGATMASLTEYVPPVFASILGAIFLDEQITTTIIIAMVIIFAGLTVFNRAPLPEAQTHSESVT